MFGLALVPYWNEVEESTYRIVATDRHGHSATASLSVMVATSNLLRVSHTYDMQIVTDYLLFTSELNHAIWWVGNVTQYFRSGMSSITVTRLEQGSVVIGWSNNSINSIEPLYKCPGPEIYEQYDIVSDGGLSTSLSQYVIRSIDLRLEGVCSEYTTSTSTSTTSTSTTTTTTPITTAASTTSTTTSTTTSESNINLS